MATNKLCSSYSFKKLMSSDKSNQLLIREAIRKIALGRSMERINLAPGGMSGIGTARMIHGYVAKIHDNPSDEEFSDYGGTGPEKKVDHDKIPLHTGEYQRSLSAVIRRVKHGLV